MANNYFTSSKTNYEFQDVPDVKLLDHENELIDSYVDYQDVNKNHTGQLTQKIYGVRNIYNKELLNSFREDLLDNRKIKSVLNQITFQLLTNLLSDLTINCPYIRKIGAEPLKYTDVDYDTIRDKILNFLKDEFYQNRYNINTNVIGSILVNNIEESILNNLLISTANILAGTVVNYVETKSKEDKDLKEKIEEEKKIKEAEEKKRKEDEIERKRKEDEERQRKADEEMKKHLDGLNIHIPSTKFDTHAITALDGRNLKKVEGVSVISESKTRNVTEEDTEGTNAVVYVAYGGQLEINHCLIKSKSPRSHAIFVKNVHSKLTGESDTIITEGMSSSGMILRSTEKEGASISVSNLDLITKGEFSPAIKSIGQSGKISLNNGNYSSKGKGSPIIVAEQSTVHMNSSTMNAEKSSIVEAINKSTVTIEGCSANSNSLMKSSDSITYASIILKNIKRQENVTTTVNVRDSNVITNNGCMIYTKHVNGQVNISNSTIDIRNKEKTIFNIQDSKTVIDCNDQILYGNMIIDDKSEVELHLRNNSIFRGSITGKGKILITNDDTSSYEILT